MYRSPESGNDAMDEVQVGIARHAAAAIRARRNAAHAALAMRPAAVSIAGSCRRTKVLKKHTGAEETHLSKASGWHPKQPNTCTQKAVTPPFVRYVTGKPSKLFRWALVASSQLHMDQSSTLVTSDGVVQRAPAHQSTLPSSSLALHQGHVIIDELLNLGPLRGR